MSDTVTGRLSRRRPPALLFGALAVVALIAGVVVLFLLKPRGAAAPQPETGATTLPARDLGAILEADPRTLHGRRAELQGALVRRVLGDRSFTVGAAGVTGERELLVLLDIKLDAGDMEGRVRVLPGQRLDLQGLLEPVPVAPRPMAKDDGLGPAEAAFLARQPLYLLARGLRPAR